MDHGQVHDLGLEDRLLTTSKDSFAAQNRFIYYPDHLVRMPGPGVSVINNLWSLFSEAVFSDLVSSIVKDLTQPVRPDDLQDESIGSFLNRRFTPTLADNIPSAIFHGIYAGDIHKLSARSILSGPWQLEKRHESVVLGLVSQALDDTQPISTDDLNIIREYQRRPSMSNELEKARKSSVFTFKGGIGDLAARLEAKLLEHRRVSIEKEVLVKELKFKTDTETPKVRASLEREFSRDISHLPSFKINIRSRSNLLPSPT